MHHEARLALVLHRVAAMSLPEAAERLGVSLSTLKRRLASAERLLSLPPGRYFSRYPEGVHAQHLARRCQAR